MAKVSIVLFLVLQLFQYGSAQYGTNLATYLDGGEIVRLPKQMDQPRTLSKRQTDFLKNFYTADTFPYLQGLRYLAEENGTLTGKCGQDYVTLLEDTVASKAYARQVLDSIGKPAAGILHFNFFWMGMFEQCRAVIAMNETNEMFRGKYCKTNVGNFSFAFQFMPLPIKIGMCFPDSCTSSDVQVISDAGLRLLSDGNLYSETSSCIEPYPWTTGDTVATVICTIFGLCLVLGTAYDIFLQNTRKQSDKPSTEGGIELRNSAENNANGKQNPEGKHVFVSTVSHVEMDTMRTLETGTSVSSVALTQSTRELVPENSKKSRKPRQALYHRVLISFSALTNGTKLFSLRKNPEAMDCLNGIRALSISWIILGHTYNFSTSYVNNLQIWGDMMGRITFQLIIASTYAVDTFFFISGFLVTIGVLKLLKKRKMNWPMFYVHRYLRLTPLYAFLLMILCTLYLHMFDGPYNDEAEASGPTIQNCYTYWWSNLVYVSNFVPPERENQCMGWGWYLANDMQFFIVSPIFLFALHKKRLVGWILMTAQWLSCVLANGIVAYENDVPVGQLSDTTTSPYLDSMYRLPYYRIGPYIMGMALADIIFNLKANKKQVRLPRWLNILLWGLAIGLNWTILYSQYSLYHNRTQWETIVASVYYALSKTMYALSLFYIIFACVTGNGGPINWLLSWRIWQPMARLSYAAYLIHPMVMYWYYCNTQVILHSNDYNYIYFYLGHMCVSFAGGLVASLLVEAPLMRLENILFGR